MNSSSVRYPVSDHCDGRLFFNPSGRVDRSWLEVWKWRRSSSPTPWPKWIEIAPQRPPAAPQGPGVVATWINHSTIFFQTEHGAVLADPVYGRYTGPFGKFGPERVHAPGVPFDALPRIAVVVLSHDHYDHCDMETLRRLATTHDPLLITTLGNGALARSAGLRRIVELDWWQSHEVSPGFSVTATPARHWSNRLSGPRNGRLWCGFFLQMGGRKVCFVGDTGYDDTLFRQIRARLGAPQLACVPIGAYSPRWFMSSFHCDPAGAVCIHRDLESQASLAMHWGTWRLSDEGRDEPPLALAAAREKAGVAADDFRVLAPGESMAV